MFKQGRRKSFSEIVLFVTIFVVLGGYIRYFWVKYEKEHIQNVLQNSRSIAVTFSMDDIKRLEANSSDLSKPEYQHLKALLTKIIQANPQARFAYLYIQKHDEFLFLVDSEPVNSDDYSPPGQVFPEASDQDIQPFQDGKEVVTTPLTDRWGTWRSVLIPIRDESTNKVIAVFGLDIDASSWQNDLIVEVFKSTLGILLAGLLFLLYRFRVHNNVLKRDYDQLTQLKDSLKESEEKFKVITQSTLDIIFIVDITGKLLFFNDSVENILGYRKEELIGESFVKFVPRSEMPHYLDRLKDVFLNKPILNFNTKIIHKDGHLVDVEINGRLIRINGELVGQGTIRDNSERNQILESLKISLTKYEVLFDTFPVGITITDASGKIIETNSTAEKFLGLSKAEHIKRKIDDSAWIIVRPDGTTMPADEFASVRALKENMPIKNVEMGIVKGENNTLWLNVSASPIPLQDHGVVIVYNDISEKKLVEIKFQQQQLFSQAIIDSLPGIFYMYSYPELKLVKWNKNHETILGYTHEELADWSIQDWKEPNSIEIVSDAIKEIELGAASVVEVELFTKDRRPIPFILSGILVDFFDRKYMMGVGIDCSELKMAEAEIKFQNTELQRLNAEKDKFFSIISHDLYAPFNTIVGFSELLVESINEKDYKEVAHYSDVVISSSRRTMSLLQNLMAWSRSQTGRMVFEPVVFNLAEVIREVDDLLKPGSEKKSIQIISEFPELLEVFADKEMISVVVRNLVSNAIKFTHPGGKIRIKAEVNSSEICVSVKDNGVGISAAELDKIFRIDVNHTTLGTQKEQGTGLGLILCQEFVEKHGGKIWGESEVDKGSEFIFTIPV